MMNDDTFDAPPLLSVDTWHEALLPITLAQLEYTTIVLLALLQSPDRPPTAADALLCQFTDDYRQIIADYCERYTDSHE